MPTKDQGLAFVKLEVFEHHDSRTGKTRIWNATAMFEYALLFPHAIQRVTLDIEPGIVEMCREKRGIVQWKLDRLCEPYLSFPIVMVELEDRTYLMIDGNHRYVRRSELGFSSIQAFIYARGQWEPFLIAQGLMS